MQGDMSGAPLDLVLAHWPVGRVRRIGLVPTGAVNQVHEVETEAGRFFLRRYRTDDVAVLRREHHLTRTLAAQGLPAIAPLSTASGASWVEAGGLHALFPAAEGVQVEPSALSVDHAEAAGEMLGRLHLAMAGIETQGFRRLTLRWPGDRWVARLEALASKIRDRDPLSAEDEIALARVEAQRDWLADPACGHHYEPAYAAQAIHGDYHHGNLFFLDGRVSGVIDWEQTAVMPRAFEAARATTYMFDMEPGLSAAFLRRYSQISGAGLAELDDGAAAWGCMRDHWVWAVEEIYLHGNERARTFIPASPFKPFAAAWGKVRAALR